MLIPPRIKDALLRRLIGMHARLTYSQEGEDQVLARLFEGQSSGCYVDVGAHHPTRFSNTYLLYRKGWRGINIDADVTAIRLFEKQRPRDVNLAVGIAQTPGELQFHRFNEPALNTFDAQLAKERQAIAGYHLIEVVKVPVRRLDAVLSEHLPAGQRIDVLSVDAEGFDYQVLASNDWARFRPRVAIVEMLQSTIETVSQSPLHQLLSDNGYELFAKTVNSVFYRDRSVR